MGEENEPLPDVFSNFLSSLNYGQNAATETRTETFKDWNQRRAHKKVGVVVDGRFELKFCKGRV